MTALIDVDVNRISWLKEKGYYANNDSLYENALLRLSNEYKSYSHNAKVLLTLADYYYNKGCLWSNTKQDNCKSGFVKAYEICEQIINQYPGDFVGQTNVLRQKIKEKKLEMKIEAVQLPDKPVLSFVKFRNTDTLYQTIYSFSEYETSEYLGSMSYCDAARFIRIFGKIPIRKKKIPLRKCNDFQEYTTEVKVDPLPKGFYLIVYSDTETSLKSDKTYTCALIQNTSLMAQEQNVNGIETIMVTDRETGKPLPNAKITMYKGRYDPYEDTEVVKETIYSNKNGIAKTSYKKYRQSYSYRVEYADDQLLVFDTSYANYDYGLKEQNRVIIFTDRSIYRPMQRVYFKAILFKDINHIQKKLLTGISVKVNFRDANWKIIAEKNLVTNEFGSIDGSFDIPSGLLNGEMILEFHNYGYEKIRVEEYKRPAFEVKFNPVKENVAFNDKVTVTAKVSDLAGYMVDNAKVHYSVVRNIQSRNLPADQKQAKISAGSLITNQEGLFSITFDALADDIKDRSGIYVYTVNADVTDVNGETRSASMDINVSNKPLLINTNLPDNVFSGKLNDYKVETTNLNGESTPASVNVEIISLKSPRTIFRKRIWDDKIDIPVIPENEFRNDFPFDSYGDEGMLTNLEELNRVAQYTVETDKNNRLDLSRLEHPGYYKIKFTADNKKGLVAEDIRYVYLITDKLQPISNMDQWLTIIKDKGEPGEHAEFWIAGDDDVSYVYYELIHANRVMETRWITTSKIPRRITFPIKEEYRGGFVVQFNMIQHNRSYFATKIVDVPFTNKMLDVNFTTFRDKLLPGENETWIIKVNNKQGDNEIAEVVASLYDASLDAIKPAYWYDLSNIYYQDIDIDSYWWLYDWNRSGINNLSRTQNHNRHSSQSPFPSYLYADINWFDKNYINVISSYPFRRYESFDSGIELDIKLDPDNMDYEDYFPPPPPPPPPLSGSVAHIPVYTEQIEKSAQSGYTSISNHLPVKTRTNFNETAFFYPKLRTNEKGETLIEFTMPEALTRWKLLSFAHTKDFKVGTYQNELITQKQVAITANPPRFFRENDVIEFTAKVNNLAESDLSGLATLQLFDAVTMQPVDGIIQSEKEKRFEVKTGESTGVRWRLSIPEDIRAITYKVIAQAGKHADGEEKTIPVLTNSILITETMPFSIRAGQEKSVSFERLIQNKSKTLRQHSLTLEYTSAPAWYAVQALPYMMEYPYECAEQTFSRFYANALATTIINKTPRIKQVFDNWNRIDSEALYANLEKNQELKQVMLEETPWVMQAKNETGRKKRMGLLFNMNRMSNEMNRAFNTLENIQNEDEGFPWFKNNPSDRFITQHIVAGIGHLEKLGALHASYHSGSLEIMRRKSLRYLSGWIWKDYNALIRSNADLKKQNISSIQLHYLYACSFSGYKPKKEQLDAYMYYLKQTEMYWNTFSTYEKAIAALVLYRNGKAGQAEAIIHSLKAQAFRSEEMGMYWKDNVSGYFWYQAPIETQAMLIEAFNEVANDEASVEEMKIWLLRNKQTNDWKTTKATSEAIYALLMTGGNLLDESKLLEVEIANKPLKDVVKDEIQPEAGTGYVKTSWQRSDITAQMGILKVTNPNQKGIAWGGMYWQYFEQSDKVTSAETHLKMNKQLFVRTQTGKGEQLLPVNEKNKLKVGDLMCVRMELRADRDYEYVHLKDMRASGFEPVSMLSGYRYQDGLWYYENIKDASTNFFITYLQKGTYVFEYDLRVSHTGDFSNGITTFQCMYAPEFSVHSEGVRVSVVESN